MTTGPIMDSLDSVLAQLGDFGKYQMRTFALVCIAVVLHSAVHIAYVFTAMDVNYRCEIPGCDNNEFPQYNPPWLTNAVPFNNRDLPAKCEKFIPYYNQTENINNNCSLPTSFDRAHTETCTTFIYKTKENTILNEYNLQCDDKLWMLTMVGTINNIGQFFGLFISGILSDKFGRRKILVFGMVLCGAAGVLKAFSPSYLWFLIFEFFDAMFGAGSYICGFILGIELVGPKKRVLTGVITSSCYAVGEVFAAGSAWLVQDWRYLIYILYTPLLFIITLFWLVPESVRWNLSKGYSDEAINTLKKVANVNGRTLEDATIEKLSIKEIEQEEKQNKHSIIEIFKSTTLVLRLINCCFCWITCAFLFYGLTLNSVELSENSYLDFILTSLVEIPAYILCVYIVEILGRKTSLCLSYLLTGVACLVFIFVPKEYYYANLLIYLLGKFGATAAFTVVYVLTSELFPTPLRHSIMGTCSTFGRIGSMISPQTPLLAQVWECFPLVTFAAMSFISGLTTLYFPETLNVKLPDTIEEAEFIGREIEKEKTEA